MVLNWRRCQEALEKFLYQKDFNICLFSSYLLLSQKKKKGQKELHSASLVSQIHEFKCLKCLSVYSLSSTHYM